MENKLNFTNEMKATMKGWKNKTFKSYVENSEDDFFSSVRLWIERKAFDITNEFVAYEYPDDDYAELTCFACAEACEGQPLQPFLAGGECKENIVDEKIVSVYLVEDTEKGKLFNSGNPYELCFETALIICTENHAYAFWRHLLFDTMECAVGKTLEEVLQKIKSVEEIQEESQEENPYDVTVERCVQAL